MRQKEFDVRLSDKELSIEVCTSNRINGVTVELIDDSGNSIELTKEQYDALVKLEKESNQLAYKLATEAEQF